MSEPQAQPHGAGQAVPQTRTARHRRIVDILGRQAVRSEGGFRTPQAPLGESVKEERMRRLATELLISAEASANLVVIRTPPGAAQFLASAIDQAEVYDILGTIAGDDTVMLISRDPVGGQKLADHLLRLAQGDH